LAKRFGFVTLEKQRVAMFSSAPLLLKQGLGTRGTTIPEIGEESFAFKGECSPNTS
jgi:hypothetical protein